jgi:hypothetical protein
VVLDNIWVPFYRKVCDKSSYRDYESFFLLALALEPAIICDKFRWRAELWAEVGAPLGKQSSEV